MKPLTCPLVLKSAVAEAPVPPPPLIVTDGAAVYPVPPDPTSRATLPATPLGMVLSVMLPKTFDVVPLPSVIFE